MSPNLLIIQLNSCQSLILPFSSQLGNLNKSHFSSVSINASKSFPKSFLEHQLCGNCPHLYALNSLQENFFKVTHNIHFHLPLSSLQWRNRINASKTVEKNDQEKNHPKSIKTSRRNNIGQAQRQIKRPWQQREEKRNIKQIFKSQHQQVGKVLKGLLVV